MCAGPAVGGVQAPEKIFRQNDKHGLVIIVRETVDGFSPITDISKIIIPNVIHWETGDIVHSQGFFGRPGGRKQDPRRMAHG